ncbi:MULTISPECIES: hypothetical protein [Protofrankia]|uniref:Uncharacterized protein n=1 Tax=Protofrankia coriariae TaxID=1562887 RepID=A0ABR5F2B3_9ACTN|nr:MULTISPECIES: hypothetical protein [Protofrankia]KLL10812.1 hypothetical protein FrCorBMG51_15455 [Protofrankia coriariae]ONH34015.1 hypothetical protein BL254_18420 [Protofrankia sp. BMG5.30]
MEITAHARQWGAEYGPPAHEMEARHAWRQAHPAEAAAADRRQAPRLAEIRRKAEAQARQRAATAQRSRSVAAYRARLAALN